MEAELRNRIDACYTSIEERKEEIEKLEQDIEGIQELKKKVEKYELYFDELQKQRKEKLYTNISGLDSVNRFSKNILSGANELILDNLEGSEYQKACNKISESIILIDDEIQIKRENIDYLKEEIQNFENEISYCEQELENYG